ncbi:phytanoyl-CoA dioxygenase family protein [Spirulina sp. 06S082]|uniref:phytanoyl-CoA dioxygenase family protein n=1 Tax=Spirulina sp. 06S082 TaxID=3110248 RepID=UPI002B212125|nr:phytanoyl-CoA dioxygenase family protein [Spirulina sp. 06S082]MEA5470454.1 phytanoyl-CoA dioxygenase family protein [Spirulina sp. 06S082]
MNSLNPTFTENGYAIAEDIIPTSLADDLSREAETIETTVPVEDPLIVEGVYCGDEWSTRVGEYTAFQKLARSPFLIDRVEGILQSPCELEPVFWSLLRISRGQGDTLWHQDTDILDTQAKIGVTLFLSGEEEHATILKAIPKSHHWPFPKKEQMHVPHADAVDINISRQTVMFHNPLLWHTSLLNSSQKPLWLLIFFYKLAEE